MFSAKNKIDNLIFIFLNLDFFLLIKLAFINCPLYSLQLLDEQLLLIKVLQPLLLN